VIPATQVTFEPANERLHVWMSIRNPGLERTPAPEAVFVQCFVPRQVVPVNGLGMMCSSQLYRLDRSGHVIAVYDLPNEGHDYCSALAREGATIWHVQDNPFWLYTRVYRLLPE
jgi:hypothetical protein